jgi:hypothetical protein
MLSTHLRLGLPIGLFPCGFLTSNLYAPQITTHRRHSNNFVPARHRNTTERCEQGITQCIPLYSLPIKILQRNIAIQLTTLLKIAPSFIGWLLPDTISSIGGGLEVNKNGECGYLFYDILQREWKSNRNIRMARSDSIRTQNSSNTKENSTFHNVREKRQQNKRIDSYIARLQIWHDNELVCSYPHNLCPQD